MTAPALPWEGHFEDLRGTVLEIGPGWQPHLPVGVGASWIGVEPDPAAADWLEHIAPSGRVVRGVAEDLPLPRHSVDVAVSSLVLCSVRDPERVLGELGRVLRPGGRFVFVEHVAARPGTMLRGAMKALAPVSTLLGGCRPDRDTGATIAGGRFSRVELEEYQLPGPFGVPVPHVAGTAYAVGTPQVSGDGGELVLSHSRGLRSGRRCS